MNLGTLYLNEEWTWAGCIRWKYTNFITGVHIIQSYTVGDEKCHGARTRKLINPQKRISTLSEKDPEKSDTISQNGRNTWNHIFA